MSAPRPTRPDGLWADDLKPGQSFASREEEITAEQIVEFAIRFDPQPFHTDAAAATGTFFDALVASGWHTAALSMRLLVEALPIATGIVGAGGEVAWPSATRPGDRLHVEGVIEDIRWSTSQPDRATLTVSHQTINQTGEIRQRTTARLLAWRRPGRDS